MTPEGDQHDIDQEWERRTLCSDESCIGVIGANGRCGVCGQPYDGPLPAADSAAFAPTQADNGSAVSAGEAPAAAQAVEPEDAENRPQAGDDWAQRRLCSDESCIGVIGANGRCRECGLPYGGT